MLRSSPSRWRIPILSGVLLAVLAGRPGASAAPPPRTDQTDVCVVLGSQGIVPADTVWTAADSPYLINCTLRIEAENSSLRIEPGVVLQFTENGGMQVRGPLTIAGVSPGDVELTTSKSPPYAGAWAGVTISELAVVSITGASVRYAVTGLSVRSPGVAVRDSLVEHSSKSGIIAGQAPDFTLSGTTVRDSNEFGLELLDRSDTQFTMQVTGNTFERNKSGAVKMRSNMHVTFSGTTARDNGINGILIEGSRLTGPVRWSGKDMPYVVPGNYSLTDGLTLAAGTVVKFGTPQGTTVGGISMTAGAFIAEGSAEDRVVFTSITDDSACSSSTVSCDTNNDGNASQPLAGTWSRVELRGAPTSGRFSHVDFRYGSDSMLRADGTTSLNVDHATFTMGAGHAVGLNNAGAVIENECRFVGNRGAGVSAKSNTPVELRLTGCHFEGGSSPVLMDPNVDLVNSGNAATGNQLNGYVLNSGDITRPRTWRATDLPFVLPDDVLVELAESTTEPTLTIEPGAVVKMGANARIVAVKGGLKSGTAEGGARVLITSLKDDSCSAEPGAAQTCDTNGGPGEPREGDWRVIEIQRTSDGAFLYDTVIRYGGSGAYPAVDVLSGNVEMRRIEVDHSASIGLRIQQVTAKVADSHFHHNRGPGISIQGVTTPVTLFIFGTTIEHNGAAAIAMDANAVLRLEDPDNPGAAAPNLIRDNFKNGIEVSGTMRNSRAWEPLGEVAYLVTGTIDVTNSATFEIRAGTIVKMEGGAITTSRGTLIIEGSQAAPVYLTSLRDDSVGQAVRDDDGNPSPGDWRGIKFDDTGGGGRVIWAEVRYTGDATIPALVVEKKGVPVRNVALREGKTTGVVIDIPATDLSNAPVEVSDTRIEGMFGDGLKLVAASSTKLEINLARNTIANNQVAIRMDANVEPTLTDNQVSGNALNGVLVNGTVSVPRRWMKANLAYVIDRTIDIARGARLEIAPGARLKAQPSAILRVQAGGMLQMAGNAEEGLVTVSSIHDDQTGCPDGTPVTDPSCDTNGDGNRSDPRPGDWYGIEIADGADGVRIERARLLYAGGREAAVLVEGDNATIGRSEIAFSGAHGVAVDGARGVTISENTFYRNRAGSGLDMANDASVTIEGNRFIDNERSIEHAARGAVITRNNVAVGNTHDPMLIAANITTNQVWQSDLARELKGTIYIEDGVSLSILPGTVVQIPPLGGLRVDDNALSAEGAVFASTLRAPLETEYWDEITFGDTGAGTIRNSLIVSGGRGPSSTVLTVQALTQKVEVLYNTFLQIGGSAIAVDRNTNLQTRVEGNLIRDLPGQSIGIITSNNAQPTIRNNRLAAMHIGLRSRSGAKPLVEGNSFEAMTGFGLENQDTSLCVDARHNWWGDASGPLDPSDAGTREACRDKTINAGAKGLRVTDHVRYDPWLTQAPPIAPLVETPSCGVTNRDDLVVTGTTGPGTRVQFFDGDQVAGEATSGSDGRFQANLRLAEGVHKLSFQSVADAGGRQLVSARTGFRVVTVDKSSPVDPAGIAFEYGVAGSLQRQPIRDITGCHTACGSPTSGRVTLPRDTEVRLAVAGPIAGSPTRVALVQEGQPDVPLSLNPDGTWRTPPFQPVQGGFALSVDGGQDVQCLGYIYIGGTGRIFADIGAPGDPVLSADFEEGLGQWVGQTGWVRTPLGHRSGWSVAIAGLQVDANGNPVLGPDGRPIRRNYGPDIDSAITYGGSFNLQGIPSPQVTFFHQYSIARGDRAVLEVRTSDTGSWVQVKSYATGLIDDWRSETVSLERYAEERRVEIRFRLESDRDPATVSWGWYVDNVAVGPGGLDNGRYDEGEPLLADAVVTLRQRNPDTGIWTDWDGRPTGQSNPLVTDTDGSYGFYSLPAGEYRLAVAHTQYGVHTVDPIAVWDGTFSVDVPLRGTTPIYMPYTVNRTTLR